MDKYRIIDETKTTDFLYWLNRQIDTLAAEGNEKMKENIFRENILPRVLPYLEYIADRDSLLQRTNTDFKMPMHIGSQFVKVPNFIWSGSTVFEYPFRSEINLFSELLKNNKFRIDVPEFLQVINKRYFSRRQTAKVFLLNFPEFKPVTNILCKIPKVNSGNWFRNESLKGIDRDKLKEMQTELQSVLSLLIL
jgi:hypothetical protein